MLPVKETGAATHFKRKEMILLLHNSIRVLLQWRITADALIFSCRHIILLFLKD
jgi:hypothetical protein